MGNLFDNLQNNVFRTVSSTMGYDATWTPAGSSTPLIGRVLLKKPTEEMELANARVDFNPFVHFIEYQEGVFPDLLERVRANENTETIEIDGSLYDVMHVEPLYDGKTLKAYAQVRE